MFSQCPDCQAIFQVSDAHLKAADGNVRCGQCLAIFNALEHRRDDLLEKEVFPANTSASTRNPEDISWHEAIAAPASQEQETSRDRENTAVLHTNESASSPNKDFVTDVDDNLEYSVYVESFEDLENMNDFEDLKIQADEVAGGTGTVKSTSMRDVKTARHQAGQSPAPSKSVSQTRRGNKSAITADRKQEIPAAILEQLQAEKAARLRPSNAPWIIGSLLLMGVFLLQGIYFSRNELARNPQLRPWLEKACAVAHCRLKKTYDIKLIEIINRDVRSHPTNPQALIASTTIINNAEFTQAYPLLTLTFSDITGTRLAQRRFTPEEYLPPDKDIEAGMAPNLPVTIELILLDPGQAAVNFEFVAETDPRQLNQNG